MKALQSWQILALGSALFAALTAIFGIVFLNEPLTWQAVAGGALITLGSLVILFG